jgi:hypothetical protein
MTVHPNCCNPNNRVKCFQGAPQGQRANVVGLNVAAYSIATYSLTRHLRWRNEVKKRWHEVKKRWLRPSQWKARSGEVAVHLNGQTAMRKEVRSEKRYEVKRGG